MFAKLQNEVCKTCFGVHLAQDAVLVLSNMVCTKVQAVLYMRYLYTLTFQNLKPQNTSEYTFLLSLSFHQQFSRQIIQNCVLVIIRSMSQ